ncbi:MAG: DUF302 domain-containing protein [Hyphomicrobiaceae bacterium]|nr:DUF302 domain-containing protein [Hyphomicrobiaceae bacterium]
MTELSPIPFFLDAAVPAGRQVAYASPHDLETTVDRLKAEIAARDLWVLAELNPQMLLAKGGFSIRPARQIFYFHPRFMSKLLAANAAAIVEAPLKFVVLAPEGAPVSVRHPDIPAAFAGYAGMAEIAGTLDGLTREIAAAATAA